MTLGTLAAMGSDDMIVAFKMSPVGFGLGTMIEIPLHQTPEQFTAFDVEKLLDLTAPFTQVAK
jgi:hypothetical protein